MGSGSLVTSSATRYLTSPLADAGTGRDVYDRADVFASLGLPRSGAELVLEGARVETAGGGVATWYDASGHGRDVAQASAANRPTPTTLNGRPAVAFAGSAQWLERVQFALTGTHTVLLVGYTSPQITRLFCDSAGASPATRSIIYGYSASSMAISGRTRQSIIACNLATPKLIVAQLSGDTTVCRINRAATTTMGVMGEGFAGLTLGASFSHGATLAGAIALFVAYSRALVATEIASLESAIMAFYSLT